MDKKIHNKEKLILWNQYEILKILIRIGQRVKDMKAVRKL